MPSPEQGGFVRFVGDAAETYEGLKDVPGAIGLWEVLLAIGQSPAVDHETVFEFPTEDDLLKVVYSPIWTILFKNLLNGDLVVYSIVNPGP